MTCWARVQLDHHLPPRNWWRGQRGVGNADHAGETGLRGWPRGSRDVQSEVWQP
jgi:hypothetical protein